MARALQLPAGQGSITSEQMPAGLPAGTWTWNWTWSRPGTWTWDWAPTLSPSIAPASGSGTGRGSGPTNKPRAPTTSSARASLPPTHGVVRRHRVAQSNTVTAVASATAEATIHGSVEQAAASGRRRCSRARSSPSDQHATAAAEALQHDAANIAAGWQQPAQANTVSAEATAVAGVDARQHVEQGHETETGRSSSPPGPSSSGPASRSRSRRRSPPTSRLPSRAWSPAVRTEPTSSSPAQAPRPQPSHSRRSTRRASSAVASTPPGPDSSSSPSRSHRPPRQSIQTDDLDPGTTRPRSAHRTLQGNRDHGRVLAAVGETARSRRLRHVAGRSSARPGAAGIIRDGDDHPAAAARPGRAGRRQPRDERRPGRAAGRSRSSSRPRSRSRVESRRRPRTSRSSSWPTRQSSANGGVSGGARVVNCATVQQSSQQAMGTDAFGRTPIDATTFCTPATGSPSRARRAGRRAGSPRSPITARSDGPAASTRLLRVRIQRPAAHAFKSSFRDRTAAPRTPAAPHVPRRHHRFRRRPAKGPPRNCPFRKASEQPTRSHCLPSAPVSVDGAGSATLGARRRGCRRVGRRAIPPLRHAERLLAGVGRADRQAVGALLRTARDTRVARSLHPRATPGPGPVSGIDKHECSEGSENVSRKFLLLGAMAVGLVIPSSALADTGFNGFVPGDLNGNIQAAIQSATVSQAGIATSGRRRWRRRHVERRHGLRRRRRKRELRCQGSERPERELHGRNSSGNTSGSVSGGNTMSHGNNGGDAGNLNGVRCPSTRRTTPMQVTRRAPTAASRSLRTSTTRATTSRPAETQRTTAASCAGGCVGQNGGDGGNSKAESDDGGDTKAESDKGGRSGSADGGGNSNSQGTSGNGGSGWSRWDTAVSPSTWLRPATERRLGRQRRKGDAGRGRWPHRGWRRLERHQQR